MFSVSTSILKILNLNLIIENDSAQLGALNSFTQNKPVSLAIKPGSQYINNYIFTRDLLRLVTKQTINKKLIKARNF